jgi:type II secretory pathway pseudopilin PulG
VIRRRAFTLVETVVATGVSAVLMLSLGSTILIASRAVPTADEPLIFNDAVERGLNVLRTDITDAVDIYTQDSALLVAVPDRSGDADPEFISFTIDADRMLARSQNEGAAHILFGPVSDADFNLQAEAGTVRAVVVTFEIPSATPSRRSMTVRLLNTPEER